MGDSWLSVDFFPDAPRRLPCEHCGQPGQVWAIQNLPGNTFRCAITCDVCGACDTEFGGHQDRSDPRD